VGIKGEDAILILSSIVEEELQKRTGKMYFFEI
jgi:hypothetical protein